MKEIEFLAGSQPFNAGDIATFEDELAAQYVTQRIARYVKPKNEEAPGEERLPESKNMVAPPKDKALHSNNPKLKKK